MDKFKILLVDDDEEMHQQIPQMFQDDRLEFHHSYSFKDSVVKLASSSFDLLISDYDLGVKSGIDLANISKKYRPNTDIFLLIVNFEFSIVQPLATEAKILQCFEKPFVPANLIQGILTLLSKKTELLQTIDEPSLVVESAPTPEKSKAPSFATIDRNNFTDALIAPEQTSKVLPSTPAVAKKLSTQGPTSSRSSSDVSHSQEPIDRPTILKETVSQNRFDSSNGSSQEHVAIPTQNEVSDVKSDATDSSKPLSSMSIEDEKASDETKPVSASQVDGKELEKGILTKASSDTEDTSSSIAVSQKIDEEIEDDEPFDLEELVELSSRSQSKTLDENSPEMVLPSPIKSIDSDLIEQEIITETSQDSPESEPEIEKEFVRPSAFKTLDGNQVELNEVQETTSLNIKALESERNEKIALEESNAFLEELVNEVEQIKGSETIDLDNLGKAQNVKVASIQDEQNEKELLVQKQVAQDKLNSQNTDQSQENQTSKESEADDSGFGFSSAPKAADANFDIDFEDLNSPTDINPAETIESNPFECKFPAERPRKDPYLRVVIAQNILSAALVCYPLEDDHHTMESVKKELELKNVVYNIDFELIEKLIKKVNLMREPILGEIIATGHSAVHGKKGYIDLSFSNSLDVSLDETGDGKVDFKNIYKIDCVREGEFLGEIIPPTMAVPGKGVTGFVLKGKNGKPRPILPGKGARFDKTTQKFYSLIEGQPFLRGNKIIVSPLYVVPNGVDYSTGNISFVGSVHVCGDVGSGFTVEAEGDILVEGIVEGATLKAGGSVKVQKGFAGADKGAIYAEGDVRCKYISNGTVEARGNVLVEDSIINSNVTSHAKVKVFDKKGNILGGLVRAQDSVRVLNLGSEFGVGTKIVVGSHFILREQLGEINKAQKMNSLKMDKISKGIQSFTSLSNGKSLDKSHMIKLKQLKAILKKLKDDEDCFEAKKDELLKEFNKKCMSKIYVRNNAYPGSSVQIGNTVYALNDVFTNCSFFEDRFKAVVKLGIYEEE